MNNINKIIYETTRGILNIEDKLSIATLFLFCERQGAERFAELLYRKNTSKFIEELNEEFKAFEVRFDVNLSNLNVKEAMRLTKEKVIEIEDKEGFYKAVYAKDPFALVIIDLMKTPFFLHVFFQDVNFIKEQLKSNQK